jgi:ABC-type multidrug transport system fused ATPase/permease subunit
VTVAILLRWLTPRRRSQLVILGGLSLVGALAELATLGAVLPFISLLSNPDAALRYPLISDIVRQSGRTEGSAIIASVTILFVAVVIGAAVLRLALTWATVRFTQTLGHDLSLRVYGRMLRQPYAYHVSRNTSEILSGMGKVNNVVGGALTSALDAAVAAILSLAIIGGLVALDWVMALSSATLFAVTYWVISRTSNGLLVANSRILSRNLSESTRAIQEGLGGIRDVLLDGSQHLHEERYRVLDNALRSALAQNNLWGQLPRYIVEALGIGIVAAMAVLLSLKTSGLGDALPKLAVLALGAQRLLPLFQRIYQGWNTIQSNRGALEDVAALADTPIGDGMGVAGNRELLPYRKMLTLQGVGFRYRDDTAWVFRGMHLSIPHGAKIGFAGETGCGKSTLLDVIMGLLTPTEGIICVDGIPLTSANLRHWQDRIAHVPQSIFLADTTLAANIAFGAPLDRIDMDRVRQAARRARIHNYIDGLDRGYETMVGERGVRLSGGQRQRVGIARALYRKADVLVLDEATSALDGDTEASVMEGIAELGGDVTVLIVAHRLSTLDACDTVVRLGLRTAQSLGAIHEHRGTTHG